MIKKILEREHSTLIFPYLPLFSLKRVDKGLTRVYKGLIALALILSLSLFVQPVYAEQELTIARGCYFYSIGKLQEALSIFQSVLQAEPENLAALEYANKILDRLNASTRSAEEINEEMVGYINSQAGKKKIEIEEQLPYVKHAQDTLYERFINTSSIGYNKREFQGSSDRTFTPSGFFISEHMRMDKIIDTYQNTFSLDARYHDNTYEHGRIRRILYSLSRDGMQFVAGDTQTRLSRFVFRDLYYRGVSYTQDTGKNMFKIVGGKVPNYMASQEEYIYPRRLFGVKDTYRFSDRYSAGVALMHLQDAVRIRSIDSAYNPKENIVGAVYQDWAVIPGVWDIAVEDAYAFSDEDRTNEEIFIKKEELKDFAHYIMSDFQTPKVKLLNIYERVGTDFRSYADLSATVNWLAGLTADRERFENQLEYRPFDPLYLDLYFSRERNNLDNDVDTETIRKTSYGTGARIIPPAEHWAPQTSLRVNFLDTLTSPGSDFTSDKVHDVDMIFELAKRYFGIDMNTSYTRRNTLDNIDTYGTYTDIYYARMAKELSDRVLLSTAYSHLHSDRKESGNTSTSAVENYFDINTALRLWASSNLTLGYSYDYDKDFTGSRNESISDSYYTSFSWPYNKYFTRLGSELTISPYYTYQLTKARDAGSKDRSIWTAALDATYKIAEDHRFSMSAYYRQDQDNETSTEGTDDYRFLMTYKKIFQ